VALRPGSAIVVPTKPAGHDPTTVAAPAPTPTSDAAPETAPATTSSARPPTAEPVQNTGSKHPPVHEEDPATKTSPVQHTEPKDPPAHPVDPATKTSQVTAGNVNNQWPLPPVTMEVPTTTNALSVLLSAMSSKAQADAAAHTVDDLGDSSNGQQHAGTQPSRSSGNQSGSKDPGDAKQGVGSHESNAHPNDPSESNGPGGSENEGGSHNDGQLQQSEHDSSSGETHTGDSVHSDGPSDAINPGTPANAGQATVTWNHYGQAFTAMSSNGAVIVQGNGATSTLAAGATGTFAGQVIEIPSAVDAVVHNGAAMSFASQAGPGNDQGNNDAPTATFTESGQVFTVAVQGNSLVLKVAGSITIMAYGAQGTFAGQLMSMPSSQGIDVIKVNGKPFKLQGGGDKANDKASVPKPELAAVITQDGKTFTAILRSASAVVVEAASTTLTISPGAVVTLDGERFSVPTAGSVLLHDGTTFTLTPTTVPSAETTNLATVPSQAGQHLSAFDFGSSIIVVVDGSTITLADGAQTTIGKNTISAASTGGAAIVNGTSTVFASTRTNVADPSASGDGGAGTTAETGLVSEGAAPGGRSLGWMSILLCLGTWIVVVWL
jgi:hypothetical protein